MKTTGDQTRPGPGLSQDRGHCDRHAEFLSACRHCLREEFARVWDQDPPVTDDSDSDNRVTIHPRDIVGNAAVRKIAGYYLGHDWRPVTRPTLLKWRAERGFPEPMPCSRAGVELWDAREVREWCKAHAERRRAIEADWY